MRVPLLAWGSPSFLDAEVMNVVDSRWRRVIARGEKWADDGELTLR